jgi:hypothetical protein
MMKQSFFFFISFSLLPGRFRLAPPRFAHADSDGVAGRLLPVKPAAASAVAGGQLSRNARPAIWAALLLRSSKGAALAGILRVFLKVGVGRVALVKLLIVLKVNGKFPSPRPVHLIWFLLLRPHPLTLLFASGYKKPYDSLSLLS